MTRNMGSTDRVLRGLAGAFLVLIALFGVLQGAWFWVGLIAGAVLLVTSAVAICPAYLPFGLRTRK